MAGGRRICCSCVGWSSYLRCSQETRPPCFKHRASPCHLFSKHQTNRNMSYCHILPYLVLEFRSQQFLHGRTSLSSFFASFSLRPRYQQARNDHAERTPCSNLSSPFFRCRCFLWKNWWRNFDRSRLQTADPQVNSARWMAWTQQLESCVLIEMRHDMTKLKNWKHWKHQKSCEMFTVSELVRCGGEFAEKPSEAPKLRVSMHWNTVSSWPPPWPLQRDLETILYNAIRPLPDVLTLQLCFWILMAPRATSQHVQKPRHVKLSQRYVQNKTQHTTTLHFRLYYIPN